MFGYLLFQMSVRATLVCTVHLAMIERTNTSVIVHSVMEGIIVKIDLSPPVPLPAADRPENVLTTTTPTLTCASATRDSMRTSQKLQRRTCGILPMELQVSQCWVILESSLSHPWAIRYHWAIIVHELSIWLRCNGVVHVIRIRNL